MDIEKIKKIENSSLYELVEELGNDELYENKYILLEGTLEECQALLSQIETAELEQESPCSGCDNDRGDDACNSCRHFNSFLYIRSYKLKNDEKLLIIKLNKKNYNQLSKKLIEIFSKAGYQKQFFYNKYVVEIVEELAIERKSNLIEILLNEISFLFL